MKVGFNIYPLQSGHKERGIGYYTKILLEALKADHFLEIEEFTSISHLKKVDVVHYPWFDLFFHTLPIKKQFPTVVTIHDVIPLIFPKAYPTGLRGKINFYLQRLALKDCRFIITDSNSSKKDIAKYLKIKDEKIAVIPLAADSSFRILSDTPSLRVKRKYHLPDQFLLYVGDANYVKNLSFLIEGFYRLIKISEYNNLKLVLVGGVFLKKVDNIDHPELESLKKVNQLIKDYDLDKRIIRPGQLEKEELVAFYNLAALYVQPSFYEGFGLPVLEAFSCGTPVICSNAGSLKDVGGEAAVYFDPTNIDQFVSIASEILSNRSLQNKLSKLALLQSKKFSWHKVEEETKLVYEKASKLRHL